MFGLATTNELVENLSFLEKPQENPEQPICRRCKRDLKRRLIYEEGVVEIVWKCPRCLSTVYESE